MVSTTFAKVQVANGTLTATLDNLMRTSRNLEAAGAAEQECMKSYLLSYMQMVFDQFKQSTEAFQSSTEKDI